MGWTDIVPDFRHPFRGKLRKITSGDVFLITDLASVQFAGDRGFAFEVTDVDPRLTAYGWVWLHGYVLEDGHHGAFRSIYVQAAGLLLFSRAGEA